MYRLTARVSRFEPNTFDYKSYYFNKYDHALDFMKDLLHNNLAESVVIEFIHTED